MSTTPGGRPIPDAPTPMPRYQRQARMEIPVSRRGPLPDQVMARLEKLAALADRIDNELGVIWNKELGLMGEEADDMIRSLKQQAMRTKLEAQRLLELGR